MDLGNPFAFRFIRNLKSIDVNSFDDRGPAVVFASPGMLQSGVSRQLFDRWATDPKNGVLIAGYAVENTLAKEIMNQPKEVVTLEGRRQPMNCLVDYVSFSAHVDFMQNRNFIGMVDPKHIILVHGQKDEMGRLKQALMLQYRQLPENKRPTITMPPNLQEVKLKFTRRRSAKVMGSLADRETEPEEAEAVRGILVTQNFNSKIVSPEDLPTYTQLRVGSVSSKLHVPFAGRIETLRLFLNEMFDGVSETDSGPGAAEGSSSENGRVTTFALHGDQVRVTLGRRRGTATVFWEAGPAGDVLADAVVSLLMHAQSSAASIRLTGSPCGHRRRRDGAEEVGDSDSDENGDSGPSGKKQRHRDTTEEGGKGEKRLRLIHDALREQFDSVEATYEGGHVGTYEIRTDCGLESGSLGEDDRLACNVKVKFLDAAGTEAEVEVECRDGKLAGNVRDCVRNVAAAAAPVKV